MATWGKPKMMRSTSHGVPIGQKPQLTLEKFRAINRNTLRGFADVRVPVGGTASIVIHNIAVHRKGERAWVSLPMKPRLTETGEQLRDQAGKATYIALLEWDSRETADRFSAKVIDLIEAKHPGASQ